jgi:hypothetical protein
MILPPSSASTFRSDHNRDEKGIGMKLRDEKWSEKEETMTGNEMGNADANGEAYFRENRVD